MEKPVLNRPPDLIAMCRIAPVALFVDFDGTLVDIAERPDAIHVPADLAARLLALSGRLGGRLALVSGRAVADIERHTGSLEIARAGSHGIARHRADGTLLGEAPMALPEVAVALLRAYAERADLVLEEKAHGAALHYRAAPQREAEARAYAGELAAAHGLGIKDGKYVVEIVRPGVDKGGAVQAFMSSPPFAGARPIFLGDDVTDEDGFLAAEALGGFGVLVGRRSASAARYGLPDIAAVHEWLAL